MEFTDYLNHVGLGRAARLTRLEWSVIKRFVKVSVYVNGKIKIQKGYSFCIFSVLSVDLGDSLRHSYRMSGINSNNIVNL